MERRKCSTLACLLCLVFTTSIAQQKFPIWEAALQYDSHFDTTTVRVVRNLNYASNKSTFTTLDIYSSKHSKSASALPVVLLVHGGPVSPNIAVKPKDWRIYTDYGRLLASKGIITVVINHRIHDEENIVQSRNDVLTAIHFIKQNANRHRIDSSAIALWMFSLGGAHHDYFAHHHDRSIKALITFYGMLSQVKQTSDSAQYCPAQLIVRCGLDKSELLTVADAYIAKAMLLNYPIEIINHRNGVHAFDIFQRSEETKAIIDKAIAFLEAHLFNSR